MHDEHKCDDPECTHFHEPEVTPRSMSEETMKTMKDNYAVVPSRTGEQWFTTGNFDVVTNAVFKYIYNHPRMFADNGDVILDAVEMANLVLAREELGLSADVVPEELVVGIIPRYIGIITKKGDPKPEVIKNSILIGNAAEISNTVMGAFRVYYKLDDADKKNPRERAKDRAKERRRNKRR